MVRHAKFSDASRIAQIHYSELNHDFLASLGKLFLVELYKAFINNNKIVILVYSKNNKVIGFISGSYNFDKEFKEILKNNVFNFVKVLLPVLIIKPMILKKIIETFFYSSKLPLNKTKAELISIAVDSSYQNKGIGGKMINALEKKLKRKTKEYKVSVNQANKNANNFYKHMGFKKIGDYNLYNKKVNLYIKKI